MGELQLSSTQVVIQIIQRIANEGLGNKQQFHTRSRKL